MTVAINDLEVKSVEILSVYLQVSVTENVWTILGPDFIEDAKKIAVIVRALYSLKLADAAFRSYLASCIKSL